MVSVYVSCTMCACWNLIGREGERGRIFDLRHGFGKDRFDESWKLFGQI